MKDRDKFRYWWHNIQSVDSDRNFRENLLERIKASYSPNSITTNSMGTAFYLLDEIPKEKYVESEEVIKILSKNFKLSEVPKVGGFISFERPNVGVIIPVGSPIQVTHMGVVTRADPLRLTSRLCCNEDLVVDGTFKRATPKGKDLEEAKFYVRK